MALTANQKARLRQALFEFVAPTAGSDIAAAMFEEVWLGFFESAAQRTARAQAWVAPIRARRVTDLTTADSINTTKKTALTTDIVDLDAITSAV